MKREREIRDVVDVGSALKHARSQVRSLQADIIRANSAVIVLEEKAVTNQNLDEKVWLIWSYVREHKDTLDSEFACKGVRNIIAAAVSEVQERVNEKALEILRLQHENARLATELKLMSMKPKEKKLPPKRSPNSLVKTVLSCAEDLRVESEIQLEERRLEVSGFCRRMSLLLNDAAREGNTKI